MAEPEPTAAKQPPPTFEIRSVAATDAEAVVAARALFREYQRLLGVDLCFQQFDAELAALPGAYAPPRGRLLLAYRSGRAIGCVALRELEPEVGELKRLYVRPQARRGGIGRELVRRLLEDARRLGYRRIRLDTLPSMREAQQLYRSLGFHQGAAFTNNPVAGVQFMELNLASGRRSMR